MSKTVQGLKKLLSESVIYGISNIVNRLISFLMIPVYTSIFSPGEYGVLSILNNGFLLIMILYVLGLDNSTARWFYDTEDDTDRTNTVNTWIYFSHGFAALMALILFVFSETFSSILFQGDANYHLLIKLIAISIPFSVLTRVANTVLRFEQRPKAAVLLTFVQSISLVSFNILLVYYLKKGLNGIYISQIISTLISFAVSFVLLRKRIVKPQFNYDKLRKMIIYSLPYIPASLAYWVINLSGSYFLNIFSTQTEAGLYQIGATIASIAALITVAFQQAWSPFAFSILNQPEAKNIYAKVFLLYAALMSLFCAGLSFFSGEILIIFTNKEYFFAAYTASILSFTYLFAGLTYIADLGAAIAKNTKPLGFILIISATLYIVFSWMLIPHLGKEGAALASLLSQIVVPVYLFWRSQQLYTIPYPFVKGAGIVGTAMLFTLCAYLVELHVAQGWYYRAVLYLFFVATILFILRADLKKLDIKSILRLRS